MSDIRNMIKDQGSAVYYTAGFRRMIEDHLLILRKENIRIQQVSIVDADVYEGDLGGYLSNVVKMEERYHWLVARINGLNNLTDFGKSVEVLILPDTSYVERLKSTHMTLK